MTAIAFSQLRKKLGEIIERVHDNEEPVTITRADGKNVVIVPESEWESRNDTAYLLSSPENAKRLLSAKKQVEAEIERRKKTSGLTCSWLTRRMRMSPGECKRQERA